MKLITGLELKNYFLSHCTHTKKHNFYKVKKPLHVFKKTEGQRRAQVIVNLIIPKGAIIFASGCAFRPDPLDLSCRKMRASEAIVHSQFRVYSKKAVDISYSMYCPSFVYKPGTKVKPVLGFGTWNQQCTDGIHFFLNLQDALEY